MHQVDTPPPDPASVQTLAEAIEADGLSDAFDGADAIVRSAIKAKRLRLPSDVEINDYVIDLVAESLSAAYTKAGDFKPDRRVVPWLLGFVGTTLQSRLRDTARRFERAEDVNRFGEHRIGDVVHLDGQPDASDDDLFAVLKRTDGEAAHEASMDVQWAIGALEGPTRTNGGCPDPTSVEHAEILRRYYLEEAPAVVLAADYGITTNAVQKRLSRARTAARNALGLA